MSKHIDRSLGLRDWGLAEKWAPAHYKVFFHMCCAHTSWSNDAYNKQAERLILVVGPNSAHWSSSHGMRALCRRRMSPLCPSWGWPCVELSYTCSYCSPKLAVLCVCVRHAKHDWLRCQHNANWTHVQTITSLFQLSIWVSKCERPTAQWIRTEILKQESLGIVNAALLRKWLFAGPVFWRIKVTQRRTGSCEQVLAVFTPFIDIITSI